jgi:exodeoxyribonuclease VII small subunit
MSDDRATFEMTRARLEDLVVQVRRKDVSLEQSLDMLEEAVRLVNQCNELIDQTSFRPSVPTDEPEAAEEPVDAVIMETIEVVEFEDGDVAVVDVVEIVQLDEATDVEPPEDDERS